MLDQKAAVYLANEAYNECLETLNLLLEDMQPKKEAKLVNVEIHLLRDAISKLHQVACDNCAINNY